MTILLEAEQIQRRIGELAAQIEADYPPDEEVHLVGVLKGGFVFMADLVRAMSARVTLDFIAVSSYQQSTRSSGEVRLLKDLDTRLEGRHVIIVEDIVDTGLTLTYLQDILRARAPKSLRTACLLSKPSRRLVDVKVEYIGFTIEDRFVIGYGLDFAEKYRNLPHIAVMDEARISFQLPAPSSQLLASSPLPGENWRMAAGSPPSGKHKEAESWKLEAGSRKLNCSNSTSSPKRTHELSMWGRRSSSQRAGT